MYRYFFFQAEDGIRDADVTGVQTCALPIYAHFDDPLGGMLLTATGFGTLAELVTQTRPNRAGVVGILEGGYHLTHLATSVLATLGVLGGKAVTLDERPHASSETSYSTVHARIRAVRHIVRTHWNV